MPAPCHSYFFSKRRLNIFILFPSELKKTAPAFQQIEKSSLVPSMASNKSKNQPSQPSKPPVSGGYACIRCGKTGHLVKFCPTIGDPRFDPEIRLTNIPKFSRKKVTSLEGVDTSNKMVITIPSQ